jgi:hypothetical protein
VQTEIISVRDKLFWSITILNFPRFTAATISSRAENWET